MYLTLPTVLFEATATDSRSLVSHCPLKILRRDAAQNSLDSRQQQSINFVLITFSWSLYDNHIKNMDYFNWINNLWLLDRTSCHVGQVVSSQSPQSATNSWIGVSCSCNAARRFCRKISRWCMVRNTAWSIQRWCNCHWEPTQIWAKGPTQNYKQESYHNLLLVLWVLGDLPHTLASMFFTVQVCWCSNQDALNGERVQRDPRKRTVRTSLR